MSELPAIPQPSVLLAPADVERFRDELVAWSIDAPESAALEYLARAQALEKYLSRIDQEGPMLTAERWLERRIGELLGPGPDKPGPKPDGIRAPAHELEESA